MKRLLLMILTLTLLQSTKAAFEDAVAALYAIRPEV